MAENNENKYIIKIKGKEVEVNEEVYRAYVRPKGTGKDDDGILRLRVRG